MSKYVKVLSIGALLLSNPISAYHFPWDQGHDTTLPNTPSNEPGTGEHDSEDSDCETGSPVYLKTGHFVWGETDVIVGNVKPLQIRRVFNSNDPKDGPFGKGWTFNCEVSLYKVTDTVATADGADTVSKYVYRVGNGRRLTFNSNESGGYTAPKRLKATLTEGNQTTLDFANGSSMSFSSSGRLLAKTDKNGNSVTYGYDENQRLVSMANGFSHSLTLDYNASGRVHSVTDQSGRTWAYDYSSMGELTSVTDPLGDVQSYQYRQYQPSHDAHAYSQLERITDPSGVVVTSVVYNGAKVQSYTEGSNQFTYTYNIDWVTKTDTVGAVWRYKLNGQGQRIEDIDPLNNKLTYTRDADGYLLSSKDALGLQQNIERDDKSRVILTDNGNLKAQYQYTDVNVYPDSITYLPSVGEATSRTITLTYDNQGNVKTITTPNGDSVARNYDSRGLVTSVIDAEQNKTSFSYNQQGQLISLTNALSQNQYFTYNQYGYLSEVRDPAGDIYRFETDALGQVLTSIDPAGLSTLYSYDEAGRLKSVTAPNNAVESYDYDTFGRLVKSTRYDSSYVTYRYRSDNLLTSSIDPQGLTTTYSYDAAKRLTKMSVGSEFVDYDYNARGQLTKISNSNDTITRSYDHWARLTSETSQNNTHSFTYNAFNEVTDWDNAGLQTQYQYNANGLMTGMTNPDGRNQFGWDKNGLLTSQQSPDGLVLANQYDPLGRLKSKEYQNGLYSKKWLYSYDLTGMLTNITEDGFSQDYQYDASQRLTAATTRTGSYNYQYDDLGNRLDFGGVYNKAGQLQEDTQYTYEYDARGNRTKRSSKDGTVVETYAYNDLARLISYQKERVNPSTLERTIETNATYSYDPLGRRIQKDVDGEITQFAWLGQQLINEIGSGSSKSYQYGPQGYAPLSVTEAGSALSVVSDHLSAPIALLNGQTERWTQARTPFGIDTLSNDYSFNIGFPGQYYDAESGLKQNYFRDYDPRTGRYIQRDPIGLHAGTNAYTYVSGNPVMYIDPTGEFGIPGAIYGAISGGIGGFISGGWKGSAAGAVAGAAVGFVNPYASHWAGAATGAAAASYAGQAVGNAVAGKDVTDSGNYNHCAAFGAAIGGGIGGPFGNMAGKYVPPLRFPIVGRPMSKPGISNAPGNTASSVIEGISVGVGEAVGGNQ